MRLQHLALLAGCALWSAGASAQPSPDLTAQQYDALFAAVNNVGRWGTDDACGVHGQRQHGRRGELRVPVGDEWHGQA